MTTYPIVLIEWRDACSLQDGLAWHSMEDVDSFAEAGAPILTVGVEVKKDKQGVVLATSRHLAEDGSRPWGDLFYLPGTFIHKRKVLGKVRV